PICPISLLYLLCASSHPLFLLCFNDPATTEIYTLSLHDALPISHWTCRPARPSAPMRRPSWASTVACASRLISVKACRGRAGRPDRKSTRLNSSHVKISYAVFCLKKKKKKQRRRRIIARNS